MSDTPRCLHPDCPWRVFEGGTLCLNHAAAIGVPGALEEQRRRGQKSSEVQAAQRAGEISVDERLEALTHYADNPVGFATDILGIGLWSHQRRALEAVRDHRRVAWRSCHGSGKSVTAATAAIWWVCTRPDSLCVITAPTQRQVRQILWRTIRQLTGKAKVQLSDDPPGDVPELGWRPTDDRMAIGLTGDKPENVAGLHARHVLVLREEDSGIEQAMQDALKGLLTGNSRALAISNPTRLDGEFFDAFHRKAHLYHRLHTSADDVIREAGGIPGVIDQLYIDELLADYGELSPVVAVKVRGEFPTALADTVIAFSLVEEARTRGASAPTSGPLFEQAGDLQLGVDPARFGDDSSVIVARRGHIALMPEVFHHLDGVQLAARVLEVAARLGKQGEMPTVAVDAIGVGASVIDQLSQVGGGKVHVVPVNVGEASTVETYERKRDEVWFALRDWLKAGGCLPNDEKLCGELIAPTFGFSPRGRLKVEPKDETKARLRRSPDRADALALSTYSAKTTRGGLADWGDDAFDADDDYQRVEDIAYGRRRW